MYIELHFGFTLSTQNDYEKMLARFYPPFESYLNL